MGETFWRIDTQMDVALVVLFVMFWVFFVSYGVFAFCKIFYRCCVSFQNRRCHVSDDNIDSSTLSQQKYYRFFP